MSIDIQNVINISLTTAPQGLLTKNVNNVALFSTETPSGWGVTELYRVYYNARNVATDFGTNSTTYAMANSIFSQTPNVLSGGGTLIIIPFLGISATSGYFDTANISANLDDIILIDDGDLKITLDGTVFNLTGLDFTNALTFIDVAKILQTYLPNAIVTAISTTGIKIQSKQVGSSSTVAVGPVSGGTGTDLSAAGYFNSAGGTATAGVNASGETLISKINATELLVQYAGVITNLEMEDSVVLTTATAIQAKDMIFAHHFSNTSDIAGVCSSIQDADLTKTRCLLYTVSPSAANLFKAAYVGRAFSTNFSGVNTSQTMHLKQLVGIQADDGVTDNILSQCKTAGVDTYTKYSGYNSGGYIFSTGGNDYFDNVYNTLALKFLLEATAFNYLAQTNTKIPQTEAGMDGLKGSFRSALNTFVTAGVIGSGLTWNSSETFGDPETLKTNITDVGFYVYSIPISQQPQIDRTQRIAPLVQMAIKFAGAIQSIDVLGIIEA